ncbi:hypothetical protein BVRB_041470 [Beta vulgaris subsp. vulgaris]|uniref:Uncharacterized protein n=1 Tax=Beta vulgaris subsp. vulgaris TaxID=3555 RepID=A0A0J7YMT3_BETVV|nr:hypothetical protein BVRB_041470 [Beta vulgaris subsp. vulgaris]
MTSTPVNRHGGGYDGVYDDGGDHLCHHDHRHALYDRHRAFLRRRPHSLTDVYSHPLPSSRHRGRIPD